MNSKNKSMSAGVSSVENQQLPIKQAILVFLAFAFAYFMSTLIRAITATLSPTLTLELGLQARDLGLLAGAYFFGFAAMQLPLGKWLDRFGPKKVIICFLSVAVLGCLAFATATSFAGLLAARVFCGAGVSACLMAPLTGYRRWLPLSSQIRANSWMLMTGSLGMVASTLPVQWLMPMWGWRGIFIALSVMLLIAILVIFVLVPAWKKEHAATTPVAMHVAAPDYSYTAVWSNAYVRSLIPMGFFFYGGVIALQTLWVAPWMIKVVGYSALEAATALFYINVVMLVTFWLWGSLNPWLVRKNISSDKLMIGGLPISFVILAMIIIAAESINTTAIGINILTLNGFAVNAGADVGITAGVLWALYFVACSFMALSQPAIAMAFPAELAGRALSAFNLVLFSGVFVVQWGIGLLIDGFKALGWQEVAAFQGAFGVFLICCIASYGYFVFARPKSSAYQQHN